MNTPKDIHELLVRLNKQTPFKVPEGYFEELEDRVISNVSDSLVEVDTQLPFEVPQGYFDGLADKVMAQVEDKQAKKLSVWRSPMVYAASIAALLMVSFGIYYIKLPSKTANTADITFSDVPTEELYLALQEDVSMDLIAEVMVSENTSTSAKETTPSVNEDTTDNKVEEKEIDDKIQVVPTEELEEFLLEDMDDIFMDEI